MGVVTVQKNIRANICLSCINASAEECRVTHQFVMFCTHLQPGFPNKRECSFFVKDEGE